VINKWENLLSDRAWPNYVLNNHDVVRSATRYTRGENDERLKVAATLLLTLRGTPYMYYGEEIGMRELSLKRSELQDPVGKRYWPINKGRDGCRTPMQWDASEFAGFSQAEPWIRVNPDHLSRNVQLQKTHENSLLNFYKKMLRVRKGTPALQKGLFIPLTYDPRSLLAYLREDAESSVLVVLNFSRRKVRLALGPRLRGEDWQLLISSKREKVPEIVKGWLPLLGNEASVYIRKNK
jgi:alpha-glucosidase